MRVEPDIRSILDDLEVGLLDVDRPMCTAGADLVRAVRNILERALEGVANR